VDVLGVDGTLITDLIAVWLEQTAQGNMIIPARWSADGHSILVAAEMSGPMQVPNAKLLAYRTDTQRVDVIAKQLADRPLFSFENMPFYAYDDPQHEQIVLVEYQSNLQQTVEMLNTNGENRHTLIHDADSVGQPLWLPDGVTVAIPWARGKGQARHSYLLLGNDQDATKLQALDYGYQDIEGVHWSHRGDLAATGANASHST